MAKDKGRFGTLVKAWTVMTDRKGDVFQSFFETKEEAIEYARGLHSIDRKNIIGIFQTGAIECDGELFGVCMEDDIEQAGMFARSDTGLIDGEFLSPEELEEIKS